MPLLCDFRTSVAFWREDTPASLQTLPCSFLAVETTFPRGLFVRAKISFPAPGGKAEKTNYASRGSVGGRNKGLNRRGPAALAYPKMARRQEEQRGGAPLMAEGKSDAEVRLILYHWTHSFSSQKVKASVGAGGADRVSAPGQLPQGSPGSSRGSRTRPPKP